MLDDDDKSASEEAKKKKKSENIPRISTHTLPKFKMRTLKNCFFRSKNSTQRKQFAEK